MGINFVLVGAMVLGMSARRHGILAPWLAWSFMLVFPSAVVTSITVLWTTPCGALWLFSPIMIACGYFVATGTHHRLVPA